MAADGGFEDVSVPRERAAHAGCDPPNRASDPALRALENGIAAIAGQERARDKRKASNKE